MLLLTVGGLMTIGSTAVANELLLVVVLAHEAVMVTTTHASVSHVVPPHGEQLAVDPVLLVREVGQRLQRQVLWRNKALNVCEFAVGALWAEAKDVVLTDSHLGDVLRPVPELAASSAQLTEAPLVVRALLLFLGGA